jgi:antitoxin HigA-1
LAAFGGCGVGRGVEIAHVSCGSGHRPFYLGRRHNPTTDNRRRSCLFFRHAKIVAGPAPSRIAGDALGELLRERILPTLGRPRAEIACPIAVSRQALHAIVTERASVSPEMGLWLGKLCGNGLELWLAPQTRYDLERLRRDKGAQIVAIPTLQAA